MNNSTMLSEIEIGKKASIEGKTPHSSSTIYAEDKTDLRMLRCGTSKPEGAFVKVNFSDERKMEACRTLNKMMGGR